MRTRQLVTVALFLGALATPALEARLARAIPPPHPPGDLEKLAELIVDVESLQALCDGPPVQHPDRTVRRFRYQLKVVGVRKGASPKVIWQQGTVVDWKPGPRPPLLPDPVYPVGWRGRLFLIRAPDGYHALVHRSGVIPHPDNREGPPLPDCQGAPVRR